MSKITISKKEYTELVDKKLKYEYLKQVFKNDIFAPPPKNGKDVIKALRDSKLYNASFIKSIQKGVKRSSHFS